jgi:hypothetical protein
VSWNAAGQVAVCGAVVDNVAAAQMIRYPSRNSTEPVGVVVAEDTVAVRSSCCPGCGFVVATLSFVVDGANSTVNASGSEREVVVGSPRAAS